ncbi:MAG: hypothetical protein L0Z62_01990 [Gemmataceae bacterium]|nr:hypothetical protein [Gemmataceae bacterium]
MFRLMSRTLLLVGSTCLLTACGGNPEPPKGQPDPARDPTSGGLASAGPSEKGKPEPDRADRVSVTLHVPDMVGRQGIT